VEDAIGFDLLQMLAEIGASGGEIHYEGDAPYPRALIARAELMNLLIEHPAGGMASAAEVLRLTPRGRRRVGVPDRETLLARLVKLCALPWAEKPVPAR
jgi:hypothetical protein